MKSIPYGRQNITDEDIQAVQDVLKADFLTQGPKIPEFEQAFSKYIGCEYSVAVSNGTAALHLSTLALGVKKGEKVITTPITFVASANCVRYADGDVLFADIDPKTYLLDPNKVEEILKREKNVKGIIPVDLAGYPVNMEAFRTLADKYKLWILEDSCHAPGGYFYSGNGNKSYCGSGAMSDLAIFSFHPVKHITCGEGGMITTKNPDLYKKLLILRTHGITKENLSKESQGEWYYEMKELGFNYRLTDFQAALGISQLKRADQGLIRRKKIAEGYNEAFADKEYIKGQSGVVEGHAYHLYIIEVNNRDGLYRHLRAHNIHPQVHYIPVHLMPYYRKLGWKEGDMPNAEKYYSRCLSLPIFPSLTDEEQIKVINTINEFYAQ